MGTWLSLFNNWETFGAQFAALALVVGSYLAAQYVRVWRPRRQGRRPARFAQRIPDRPADAAVSGTPLSSGFTAA
jgi:high-affinity iron transporter